jgi:uncharacterized protein YndB with AHSA1/START domain
MSETVITREFSVSAERLYEALADQDKMSSWIGAKVSVPVRGANGALVGTVRRIHVGLVIFDERIEAVEPARSITYAVVPPMPLLRHHLGQMRIEPLGPHRSRLTWRIQLELALGADRVVGPVLGRVLALGLARLARRLSN